ncbi:hypothetical protein [Pseudoxanthomonas sp. X-1]|uniref:hypothetical protein n=1 Tax=Pseudoxanthomonas sp. X-1 TaxID=2571115 RepID=UPI00110B52BB|nr:hypothetical protein [Pseudoxanthomonas sp. X-1]TMN18485.1 hypothetical protein FF950_14490 [Pseudoxanthomonas sp. X-1]UAY76013.1 hypothetical protein LAJ50_07185 [Pseudoxanthomonas sp. X-1]
MSDTYTKLFRSIAASTIVSEPLATRWLWVTLLSQADKGGNVYGSIPGLARLANISLQEVEQALQCLMSPDPYSRTPDNEGRRLAPIDGGWRLLNHAKYAAIRDKAERADYKREWDRANRSKAAKSPQSESDISDTHPTDSGNSDTHVPTNTNTNTKDQKHSSSATPTDADELAQRLAQVTREAVEAYNASPLTKRNGGNLPNVSASVGREKRQQQVRRCLRVAREICRESTGTPLVTPEFWAAYFDLAAEDDFYAGRIRGGAGHENFVPDFETLTSEKTMLKLYDRQVAA